MSRHVSLFLILFLGLLVGGAWLTWSLLAPGLEPEVVRTGDGIGPSGVDATANEPPALVEADRTAIPEAPDPEAGQDLETEEAPPGTVEPTGSDAAQWIGLLRVAGRVTGDDGPIGGARVTMRPSQRQSFHGIEGIRDEPRQVVTPAHGGFEFPALWVHAELQVEARGYGSLTLDLPLRAEDLPVRAVDVELDHAQSIAGRIVTADSNPLQGALVTATMTMQGRSCTAVGTADASGFFFLDDLAPGEYQVDATARGFIESHQRDVKAGTQDLEITLGAQPSVSGRVLNAQTGGPVPSFTVFLARPVVGGQPRRLPGERGSEHANGSFELDQLDPGIYVLEVQAPNLSPTWSQPFTLRVGEVRDGLLIAMGVGGVIHGQVLDPAGQAVVSTEVLLSNQPVRAGAVSGIEQAMDEARGNLRRVRTDETGGFRFLRVPTGRHHLVVRHPVFQDLRVEEVLAEDGKDTDLGSLRLSPGAVLHGVARDGRGGILVGATIQAVARTGRSKRTTSDARGAWRLTGLEEGTWMVGILQYASTTGESVGQKLVKAQRSMVEVQLTVGETTEQDLALGEG